MIAVAHFPSGRNGRFRDLIISLNLHKASPLSVVHSRRQHATGICNPDTLTFETSEGKICLHYFLYTVLFEVDCREQLRSKPTRLFCKRTNQVSKSGTVLTAT